MIAWTIYLTFAGALFVLLLPRILARWTALSVTAAGFAISAAALFDRQTDFAQFTTIVSVPWVPALGMNYHLAADGISLTLTLVTGLTAVCAVLFSWKVETRPNEFFFWLLLVVGGSYGVFLSVDLFLFFVFYELVIVPKYFLIAIWGSTNKEYGAMKLTLYSFVGGALVFVGILAIYAGAGSLDLLRAGATSNFLPGSRRGLSRFVFLGFAILAGIWPFHTWAPTGHVAAPTAASMLLAGVVMKLGAYGALRVAMTLFPFGFRGRGANGSRSSRSSGLSTRRRWRCVQNDLKFVIGYSSVSHMGFVLLGLAAGNLLGVSGAVLQMFSHGVIGALLFALAGAVYSRTHTRNLGELSWMRLSRKMPFLAMAFVIASAASMGIPGFSGFAAEIIILIGAWKTFPLAVGFTGLGMVLVAAFTLRALRKSFFGDDAHGRTRSETTIPNEPATSAEMLGASLLIFATLAVGLYPKLLLDRIMPAVETMRFLQP